MTIQNPSHIPVPRSLYGGGLLLPYLEAHPRLGEDIFLAPHTAVIGDVTLGNQVSVWFGSVIRGDIAPIEVGDHSNIQDNCVLHVGTNEPCLVKNNVVVGHQVTLHGCIVEDDCLIGMGAIVLNRAVVGQGSIIGAGALVTQDTHIPPYSLVLGSPAKVIRELTMEERQNNAVFAPKYIQVAHNYRRSFPPDNT
jgi:gamma-carbonic anhydrase